jgi:hypothetical protein
MTAEGIKRLLNLTPHPCEGGWFVQTWRAEETIPPEALPARYPAARAAGTCIYYLLEPGSFSEMHRLASDEIFHFYLGDPVEMLQLASDGSARKVILGCDLWQRGSIRSWLCPSLCGRDRGWYRAGRLRCWDAR